MRKRKKSLREEQKLSFKNKQQGYKNKYMLEDEQMKAEEIAFDYYGISSTSISESREK